MPTEAHALQLNRVLASLPADEFSRLADDLELVSFPVGKTLYEPGDSLLFAHFPTTCVFSLVSTSEDGSTVEVAMTGKDGMVGIPLVLGGETTNYKVVVQCAGEAYRLRAEVLCWEIDQGVGLHRLALGYTQALLTQIAQNVLCNRHHSVDQQLCRWLLFSLDLIPGNQLDVTQDMISNLLGVRREGVTEAAGKLQAAGFIHYRRGHITVVDRAGLEARVCECYRAVKLEYERLFAMTAASLARHRARLNPNPATLRQRAEARLSQAQAAAPDAAPPSPWDTAHLVHELQVHQIELEMHNEALQHAYQEADALRERYADIYDFAPVAYFSLDAQGVILQVNLAGAILLGIKRSQMGRFRFAASVEPAFLLQFTAFFEAILHSQTRLACEITLMATSQRPAARVRIEAIADDDGRECRMVVIDVSGEARHAAVAALPPAGGSGSSRPA
jgi:PAS domain-containing protein